MACCLVAHGCDTMRQAAPTFPPAGRMATLLGEHSKQLPVCRQYQGGNQLSKHLRWLAQFLALKESFAHATLQL